MRRIKTKNSRFVLHHIKREGVLKQRDAEHQKSFDYYHKKMDEIYNDPNRAPTQYDPVSSQF